MPARVNHSKIHSMLVIDYLEGMSPIWQTDMLLLSTVEGEWAAAETSDHQKPVSQLRHSRTPAVSLEMGSV